MSTDSLPITYINVTNVIEVVDDDVPVLHTAPCVPDGGRGGEETGVELITELSGFDGGLGSKVGTQVEQRFQ